MNSSNQDQVEQLTPGPVMREGTFLYQLDALSGDGINLWSGQLSANNGYPKEHALRAAKLFEAAPDLLAEAEANSGILQALLFHLEQLVSQKVAGDIRARIDATNSAIAKAKGGAS